MVLSSLMAGCRCQIWKIFSATVDVIAYTRASARGLSKFPWCAVYVNPPNGQDPPPILRKGINVAV